MQSKVNQRKIKRSSSISITNTQQDLCWDKINHLLTVSRLLVHITLKNSIRMIIIIKKEGSWIKSLNVTFRRLIRNNSFSKELEGAVVIHLVSVKMKISILISKETADMKGHWNLTLMMICLNHSPRRLNQFRATGTTLKEGRRMGNSRRRDTDARISLALITLNSL